MSFKGCANKTIGISISRVKTEKLDNSNGEGGGRGRGIAHSSSSGWFHKTLPVVLCLDGKEIYDVSIKSDLLE